MAASIDRGVSHGQDDHPDRPPEPHTAPGLSGEEAHPQEQETTWPLSGAPLIRRPGVAHAQSRLAMSAAMNSASAPTPPISADDCRYWNLRPRK